MASGLGPITSWKIDGKNNWETVTDFVFLGSKITADDDCSHEIKRLAPWKERYNNTRQCIKKKTKTSFLLTKICIFIKQLLVFPVVGYGCESWTMKKDEH